MDDSQRRVSDALDALTAAVEDEELPAGVTWSLGYLRAWMEGRMLKIVPDETEYVLVPVTEVPTPEQRAAVGRLVEFVSLGGQLLPGDFIKAMMVVEAARAVAEGGHGE